MPRPQAMDIYSSQNTDLSGGANGVNRQIIKQRQMYDLWDQILSDVSWQQMTGHHRHSKCQGTQKRRETPSLPPLTCPKCAPSAWGWRGLLLLLLPRLRREFLLLREWRPALLSPAETPTPSVPRAYLTTRNSLAHFTGHHPRASQKNRRNYYTLCFNRRSPYAPQQQTLRAPRHWRGPTTTVVGGHCGPTEDDRQGTRGMRSGGRRRRRRRRGNDWQVSWMIANSWRNIRAAPNDTPSRGKWSRPRRVCRFLLKLPRT